MGTHGQSLSDPERVLIAELAVGIARKCEAFMRAMGDFNNPPGFLFHQFSKPHRRGCELLASLGAAEELYYNNQLYYRIASEAEIRKNVPGAAPDESVLKYFDGRHPRDFFGRLLHTYVELACAHGATEVVLPDTRKAFVAQPEYAREIDALASCGYLTINGPRVKWANKIARAMLDNSLWEEDGRSRRDIHNAEFAPVATAFLDAVRAKCWRGAPRPVTPNSPISAFYVELFKRVGDKDRLMSLTVEELMDRARTSNESQFIMFLIGKLAFSTSDIEAMLHVNRAARHAFAAVHRALRDSPAA